MFKIRIKKPYDKQVVVSNLKRSDYLLEVTEVDKYLLAGSGMIYHLMSGMLPDYRLVVKNVVISSDALYDCDIEFMGSTKHFTFDAMDLTKLSEETLRTKILDMISQIKTWILSLINLEVDVVFVEDLMAEEV